MKNSFKKNTIYLFINGTLAVESALVLLSAIYLFVNSLNKSAEAPSVCVVVCVCANSGYRDACKSIDHSSIAVSGCLQVHGPFLHLLFLGACRSMGRSSIAVSGCSLLRRMIWMRQPSFFYTRFFVEKHTGQNTANH